MKYKAGDTVVLKNGDVVEIDVIGKFSFYDKNGRRRGNCEITSFYHVPFPFFKRWLVRINPLFMLYNHYYYKRNFNYIDCLFHKILNPQMDKITGIIESLDLDYDKQQLKPLLKMPKYQRFLLAWAVYIYLRLRGGK